MRPFCYRCHKAGDLCVCTSVRAPLAHRCPIDILQHPRERHHPFGTARLLRLGLQSCRVHVCRDLAAPPNVTESLAQRGAAVLFPSPNAEPIESVATRIDRLIVLDGTWPHARSLYRHNPWLKDLPHVSVASDNQDRYRIRREPRAGYMSTLEAVVRALQALEPDPCVFETLLGAFVQMIDAQLPQHRRAAQPRRKRRRARQCGVPPALPFEL